MRTAELLLEMGKHTSSSKHPIFLMAAMHLDFPVVVTRLRTGEPEIMVRLLTRKGYTSFSKRGVQLWGLSSLLLNQYRGLFFSPEVGRGSARV
jgi:hypothetical protein